MAWQVRADVAWAKERQVLTDVVWLVRADVVRLVRADMARLVRVDMARLVQVDMAWLERADGLEPLQLPLEYVNGVASPSLGIAIPPVFPLCWNLPSGPFAIAGTLLLFLYLCLCCGNDQAMTSSTTTHDDAHAKDDADIRGSGSGPTCGGRAGGGMDDADIRGSGSGPTCGGRAGGGMDDADGSVRATATSDGAGATTGDGAGAARAATGHG
jgi:hypothetical protein